MSDWPTVTVYLVSHMKPTLDEAIDSVLAQTRTDIDLVVMDSGAWITGKDERSAQMRAIYMKPRREPVMWAFTGEEPGLATTRCPISWATNQAIRRFPPAKYVCHFYDDDLYYPTFIEKMAGYLDDHPEERAVLCAQDRLTLARDGTTQQNGLLAHSGRLGPGQFDCRVDGGQIMYRRDVLDAMGDPWMDENPSSCFHSDGIFLERIASIVGSVPAIPDVLLAHRNTPYSTYSPS